MIQPEGSIAQIHPAPSGERAPNVLTFDEAIRPLNSLNGLPILSLSKCNSGLAWCANSDAKNRIFGGKP